MNVAGTTILNGLQKHVAYCKCVKVHRCDFETHIIAQWDMVWVLVLVKSFSILNSFSFMLDRFLHGQRSPHSMWITIFSCFYFSCCTQTLKCRTMEHSPVEIALTIPMLCCTNVFRLFPISKIQVCYLFLVVMLHTVWKMFRL